MERELRKIIEGMNRVLESNDEETCFVLSQTDVAILLGHISKLDNESEILSKLLESKEIKFLEEN